MALLCALRLPGLCGVGWQSKWVAQQSRQGEQAGQQGLLRLLSEALASTECAAQKSIIPPTTWVGARAHTEQHFQTSAGVLVSHTLN